MSKEKAVSIQILQFSLQSDFGQFPMDFLIIL